MGVGRVRLEGVLDRPQHGSMSGLMEHHVDVLHRLLDLCLVGDVRLDQIGLGRDVLLVTGGQVIEHANVVAVSDQPVSQIRSDEARAAGDKCSHARQGSGRAEGRLAAERTEPARMGLCRGPATPLRAYHTWS